MKLNGKNIITDKDITVTGAQNLGDNLSEILQKHQKELEALKGNVKWLYKYGGTGSGGGGGTGSGGGGKWEIFATLGGRTLSNGGVISLSKTDNSNYTLNVSVKNGNGYFSVTVMYDAGKSTTFTLSPENGWKSNLTLYLPKNEIINIVVEDGTDIKQLECSYITSPYTFGEIKLVNDEGIEYSSLSGDVLFENAKNKGLTASIDYDIAIEASTSYKWVFKNYPSQVTEIDSKSGKIEYQIPKEILEDNNNAGAYEVSCIIEITPKNQEKETLSFVKKFNLIPDTLYLKVTPKVGSFYNDIQEPEEDGTLNVYKYKTSSSITFTVRAYFGNNRNRSGKVESILSDINEDGSSTELNNNKNTPIIENEDATIEVSFATPGWKKLELVCVMGGASYSAIRYIYVEKIVTSYNWYKKSAEPTATTYYRMGTFDDSEKLKSIFGNNIYHQVSNSSNTLTINSDSLNIPQETGDILISIGIQYNEINNVKNPIMTFNYLDDSLNVPFCEVYQNKINIENKYSTNIFFEKIPIDKYNPGDSENYHLIQILLRHTCTDPREENTAYKQFCIYVDGVIETSVLNWINYAVTLDNIVIYPGNYSINLLEVSYFSNYLNRVINDVDINYYHSTYELESGAREEISKDETDLLESFYNYDPQKNASIAYTIENKMIKLSNPGIITDISRLVEVPTLVCRTERILTSFDKDGNTTVFDWLNFTTLTEQDSSINNTEDTSLQGFRCPVTLRWYNNPSKVEGKSGIDFSGNLMSAAELYKTSESDTDSNVEFYLRLQGSSTMRFKSKNFTLGVRKTSADDNAPQPVFSPNFDLSDSSTFLPDEAFTLKADMVDSSHSNNTSLGKFINDVYSSAGITSGSPEGVLRDHVKTCLEGFPFLLFLEVSDASSGTAARETEYYFLGIYNFNLGRENQFNLGYTSLNALENASNKVLASDRRFYTCLVKNEDYEPVDNLIIAEVQGNEPVWDFSQYDNSILFKMNTNDKRHMFGDIIYGSQQNTSYKRNISNFVRSVSGAGNYIYTNLGKRFLDVINRADNKPNSLAAYKTVNTVPDSDKQYKRNSDGETYSEISRSSGADLLPPRDDSTNFTKDLLYSCILQTESGNDVIPEYLDYNSAVYYYTICMAFGLVDSVQKNLNIKSWNGKTFGLYFYDMDTSLGTSNAGTVDTSYFCFSDYWKTKISEEKNEEDGSIVVDEDGNPIYNNNGIEVFRDHYPEDAELPGYDIPSTYLFAISKYAASFGEELNSVEKPVSLISPQFLWGVWRKKGGILETADKFIDKYFAGHLSKIPNVLLNLNYRNKYLYDTEGNLKDDYFGFNSTELDCLKGRQIHKVRDWLTSRFHLLDAYFNLSRENKLIHQNGDKTYYEPISNESSLSENKDIVILHDIFKTTDAASVPRNGSLKFVAKAGNYTPLIHYKGNGVERYLFEDENKKYSFSFTYSNQTSNFGGSEGWTYLDSLDGFISTQQSNSGFYLNTKKLENVIGTKGSLTGSMTLNIPSTKTLTLTSPDYRCGVTIDDKFYNLTDINIDGSKIQLDVTGSRVSTISLKGINSEKVSIRACDTLKTVTFSDKSDTSVSTITDFTADPIWKDAKDLLNLSNLRTKTLTLGGRGGDLTITSSTSTVNLDSLTFSNFRKITLSNCAYLREITCNDNTNAVLTELKITGAARLSKVVVVADNLETLDLTGCTLLSELELRIANNSIEKLEKLKVLKLGSTSIEKIKYTKKSGNNWIELNNGEELDLTYLPGLTDFRINDNPKLKYVKVSNEENNPFNLTYFSSSSSFSNCTNLRRVYGHLKLNNKNSFYNCNKFSIHGYYERVDDDGNNYNSFISDTEEYIKYNSAPVSNGNGHIYHPLEETVKDKMTVVHSGNQRRMRFQEGDKVTNITLDGTDFTSCFYKTSCTIFDIYYIFQNLYKNRNEIIFSSCFSYVYPGSRKKETDIDIHRFNWTNTYDNSPYHLMFKDWGSKIKTLSSVFQGSCRRFRIFSTSYEENGTVKTQGLFYYLPNITSISAMFHGGTYYTDNNVFKSSNNKFDKLTSISYFNPHLMIDGINTVNYGDIFTVNENDEVKIDISKISNIIESVGNCENLLYQCQKLSTISYVFTSTYLIDYDKFNINIPNTVTDIIYSFCSTYAIGEMNLDNIFNIAGKNNTLRTIDQSFIVRDNIETKIPTLKLKNVVFKITNDTFKNFNALTSIGFRVSNIDASGELLTSKYSSFTGYINKQLVNGEFPYDIISHLTNLVTFTGFFWGCDSINTTNNSYNEITLPQDLFKNNTSLENISRCFQDFKGKIILSESGFENCKLSDVSYLFCNSIDKLDKLTHYGNVKLGIQSMIPNKFFYQGKEIVNLTITGSNTFVDIDVSADDWAININSKKATKTEKKTEDGVEKTIITEYSKIVEFVDNDTKARLSPISERNITITDSEGYQLESNRIQVGNSDLYDNTKITTESLRDIPNPNKRITDMSYCFQGQGWIQKYIHEILEDDIEPNIQYQPYRYIKDSTTRKWSDCESTQESGKYTYMWVYDGYSRLSNDLVDKYPERTYYLPDVDIDMNKAGSIYKPTTTIKPEDKVSIATCSKYFFCPPDLFRYSDTKTNITNIFSNCGYSDHINLPANASASLSSSTVIQKYLNFGIEGRICPYLLKPIPDITSIEGFLTNAKRLSYYYLVGNNDQSYLIPKNFFKYTISISNLNSAFKGMVWPSKCDLQVFTELKEPLNVDYTFQLPWFEADANNRFGVNGVFVNNSILSAKATFSISTMPANGLPQDPSYIVRQYVNFGINFTKSKMPTESDAENPIVKCVYDGYAKSTVNFSGYNSSNNTTTEFVYQGSDQNNTPFNYRVDEGK